MANLTTRIARNSKKLTRKIERAPKMAALLESKRYQHWTKYSRNMAALIITTWSIKMINKMNEKKEAELLDQPVIARQR